MLILLGSAARRAQLAARRSAGRGRGRDDRRVGRAGSAIVVGAVVAYTVVLVGHGLPFWLASTIYVTASILVLQAPQRAAEGRGLTLRESPVALAIGLASGWHHHVGVPGAFLVRLP